MFSQLQDDDEAQPAGTEPGIQSTAQYRLTKRKQREMQENRIALVVRVFAVLLALVAMATDEASVGIFAVVLMMIAARVDR